MEFIKPQQRKSHKQDPIIKSIFIKPIKGSVKRKKFSFAIVSIPARTRKIKPKIFYFKEL